MDDIGQDKNGLNAAATMGAEAAHNISGFLPLHKKGL
jgi:hypothetical protein